MDVNGTRHHLVSGARDWLPALAASSGAVEEGLAWDPRNARVTLRRELFRFPPRGAEVPFTPDDRRGAARDRFGHTYWISGDRTRILVRPGGSRTTGVFWSVEELRATCEDGPAGDFRPLAPPTPERPTLSGLAVTDRHFLVVGTRDPGGLLVFDLHGGGPPQGWLWPEALGFAPFDLAPTPDGGLWILDRPTLDPSGAGGARLWRLDRDLRVVRTTPEIELRAASAGDFRPLGGEVRREPGRSFPAGIDLGLASPLAADETVSVVALPDDSVLVLESPAEGSTVRRLQDGLPPGAAVDLADPLAELLGEETLLVGHDMAFLPDPDPFPGEVRGTLWVASVEGNQSFAFVLFADLSGTFELTAVDAYLPMRRFAGKALIEGGPLREACDVFYDLEDGWLALTEVPRPRFEREGSLDALLFDGKEPATVWHRLFLDACIPPGSAVEVESRAADELDLLAATPWHREPAPGLRPGGSERAWHPASAGASPDDGTWELLFQEAKGRWLELRLRFSGNGRSTPRLGALRVHYPRFSYLERYLPAVYREDPASASFLDRFLANFEGFFTEIEGRVAGIQTLFDPRTAPTEALDWLAGWLGAVLDPDWGEDRRRLFLAHAFELYRRRGTPRGLVQAVRLATDDCPDEDLFNDPGTGSSAGTPFNVRLVESFRARRLPGTVLGDAAAASAIARAAHRFTVLVPVGPELSPGERLARLDRVRATVEREKPSHTEFDVRLYWALFRVGSARVALDTALGEGSRLTALSLGASYLGESLLAEEHPWNVDDRRVVGRDTIGGPPPLV